MLAANQINEQPLENRFVPRDQDLGNRSSYVKKKAFVAFCSAFVIVLLRQQIGTTKQQLMNYNEITKELIKRISLKTIYKKDAFRTS